ncbi:hypothetical protein CHS0354_018619 [Potamilus streckersoni]|uniref:Uncharacterized protein n=1 Tax=Potamilus streckersoni TaxID=2493646 RepID=A0AAE0SKS4_9BIVA|nr:hypothetical protein CHS0354_018619 [Potamilus streckersoni]
MFKIQHWRCLAVQIRWKFLTVIGVFLLSTALVIALTIFRDYEIEIPRFDELEVDDFPPLGIETEEEYPSEASPLRIPPIIHQTWRDRNIPSSVTNWMKSWIIYHSKWRYIYWTDNTALDLILNSHVYLLPIYYGYPENIRRADAMRYVILYEYGGVYADMDMESLRSLEPIVRKYSCILAQEPYEHPIMDGNFEHLVINAFMACAKKHPFMKLVVDRLKDFSHFWNVLDSTGPHFLTFIYKSYQSERNIKSTDDDGVYLAPAEYFFPTLDPVKFPYMRRICDNFHTFYKLKQRACVSLKVFGLRRRPFSFSFTQHHWIHTYLGDGLTIRKTYDLLELVPHAEMYDFRKGLQT